jgi:DNA modification methylase
VFWGETKERRAFEDRHASTKAYIDFMRPRCVELARVLKPTGSLYYHCDWHASHYVKVMLDQILGENQFLNEIVWKRADTHNDAVKQFPVVSDSIFLYAGGAEYTFNPQYVAHSEKLLRSWYLWLELRDGTTRRMTSDEITTQVIPAGARRFNTADLGSPNPRPNLMYKYKGYPHPPKGWRCDKDIVLDAFCGCGTALIAAQRLQRRWIGIDVSPTACRVMAKRLVRDCGMQEGEEAWRAGSHGFIVRDLPWSEEQLRKIPPFEFENWAVIALGGIANKAKVGDMGIDGRIYPASAAPDKGDAAKPRLSFMDLWYPIQVKQKDKAGRPDIDAFEAMMVREERAKGFFVAFDYTHDAEVEIDRFFRQTGKVIVPFTVREILDEQIAHKLA